MYKRRKVFSKIGEKTFSTTEFQTQKEFAAKKKSTEKIDGESKKEKVAKAGAIGGSAVALGGNALALKNHAKKGYHSVMENYHDKALELSKDPASSVKHAVKSIQHAVGKEKAKSDIIKNAKTAKRAGKVGLVGLGISAGSGLAYKALKKKKDQKEFADKEFSESEKKDEGKKTKTAGKVIAGTGAATYIGAQASAAKTGYDRAKAIQKIAEKTGTTNIGGSGVVNKAAQYLGNDEAIKKASELDKRHAEKAAKVVRRAGKASLAGLGLAGVGAGTYLVGRHKSNKKD